MIMPPLAWLGQDSSRGTLAVGPIINRGLRGSDSGNGRLCAVMSRSGNRLAVQADFDLRPAGDAGG